MARYLADKSALVRMEAMSVRDRLVPLLDAGEIATCAIVDLEVLYSTRSSRDYDVTMARRRAHPSVPITPAVTDRALDVQRKLAKTGHHRVSIPDLLIAAAAESAELAVLHYDSDYEVIASVTSQPHEWVVPRGEA